MSIAFTFDAAEAEDDLLSQALYVEDGNDDAGDESQPPATAQEYLRRVMKEAKHVDFIGIAKNYDQLLKKGATPLAPTHVDRSKADVPTSFLPTVEWQNQMVADFSELRQILERNIAKNAATISAKVKVPNRKNEKGWCTFCFGDAFWQKVEAARRAQDSYSSEEESEESSAKKSKKERVFKQHAPTTQVLCQLKHTEVELLIELQVEWAELVGVTIPEQGLWMYSLLARLEKPLTPDSGSTIRTLAMICSKERKQIFDSGSHIGLPENQGMLIHLNLLICLVGRYFDQRDLAD